MFTVKKRLEISASHRLNLGYESKCKNLHGHNWILNLYLKSENLNENGMVEDFTKIKKLIVDTLDHKNLNDIISQPTAENIALFIATKLGEKCYKVEVQESEGNTVVYER